MEPLTDELKEQLLANGRQQAAVRATCAEIDPDAPALAFGLCDLGLGFPELGSVSLSELAALRGRLGLPVERDLYFVARKPLSPLHASSRTESGAGRWCAPVPGR